MSSERRLKKDLRLFDVYAISTGAMFSSGFFLLPGLAAAMTGPSVALAYLVAALFILPAMFSVAELATAMPKSGGAYYFVDRALGPLAGTVGGLGTWLALVLKSAFALVGMGAYLGLYVELPIRPVALVLTVLFVVINVVGAKETSGLQRILVTILLIIMVGFVVHGLSSIATTMTGAAVQDRFDPFLPFGFQGFMATVGFVFVSYAGLTKATSVAEEVRNPDRDIPLGMLLSLITAAAVYALGVFVIVAVLPPETLREDLTPVASAASAFFTWLPPSVGTLLIVVAAVAAFASTGNAGILSASRYPLAMARDKLVSEKLADLGRFGTPTPAIVLTGVFVALAILFLDVEAIAKLASAFQLLLFSILCLAVIIMRESAIEGYAPGFRSPLYPWIQIVGFVTPFWLIAEMGELAVIFTMCLIALTIGWFFYYGRRRAERAGAVFHAFERLGALKDEGLDHELGEIARGKGLRPDDEFERLRAGALSMETAAEDLHGAIDEASRVLASHSGLPADMLSERFRRELDDGFMPIARGAALPHLRSPELERSVLLLARSRRGLRVPDPRGERPDRVHAALFLLSSETSPGRHLRYLGHLATLVESEGFIDRWLASETELLPSTLKD